MNIDSSGRFLWELVFTQPLIDTLIAALNAAAPYIAAAIVIVFITIIVYVVVEALTETEDDLDVDDNESDPNDYDDDDSSVIKHPGNDPTQSPGKDWEWRGNGDPGSGNGSWYNKNTGDSLHNDLSHGEPYGPHWDLSGPRGDLGYLYRFFYEKVNKCFFMGYLFKCTLFTKSASSDRLCKSILYTDY
jgi:hypothetical protein